MVLIVHMGCVQGDIAFLEAARTEAGTGTQLVVGLLNDADVAMATGNPMQGGGLHQNTPFGSA